jgi:hypothetical protein
MRLYAIGTPSLPITTEVDSSSICPKTKLHKVNKSTLLPAGLLNTIKVFLLPLDLSRAIFKS